MNKLNDKNEVRNSRKELTNTEITEALKDWLRSAEDVKETDVQNYDSLEHDNSNLSDNEITQAIKSWLITADIPRETKLQNFDLLGYDNRELSGDDCLHKAGLLYQVIKENFTDSLNIISMLYGYKHNVYESFNFVDGYIEKKQDFSIFG